MTISKLKSVVLLRQLLGECFPTMDVIKIYLYALTPHKTPMEVLSVVGFTKISRPKETQISMLGLIPSALRLLSLIARSTLMYMVAHQ